MTKYEEKLEKQNEKLREEMERLEDELSQTKKDFIYLRDTPRGLLMVSSPSHSRTDHFGIMWKMKSFANENIRKEYYIMCEKYYQEHFRPQEPTRYFKRKLMDMVDLLWEMAAAYVDNFYTRGYRVRFEYKGDVMDLHASKLSWVLSPNFQRAPFRRRK